jgi:hypothetical protein
MPDGPSSSVGATILGTNGTPLEIFFRLVPGTSRSTIGPHKMAPRWIVRCSDVSKLRELAGQFSVGGSAESTMRTSTGPRVDSNFNPSCSWSAVTIDGAVSSRGVDPCGAAGGIVAVEEGQSSVRSRSCPPIRCDQRPAFRRNGTVRSQSSSVSRPCRSVFLGRRRTNRVAGTSTKIAASRCSL